MGTVVLDPAIQASPNLRVYAHCANDAPGGVALLALNTDTEKEQVITLSMPAERFTMTARELISTKALVNGREPFVAEDGTVGALQSEKVQAGAVKLAPASATFLVIPGAGNKACM